MKIAITLVMEMSGTCVLNNEQLCIQRKAQKLFIGGKGHNFEKVQPFAQEPL